MTQRDAEHTELIALMREAVENTRKLLEMWEADRYQNKHEQEWVKNAEKYLAEMFESDAKKTIRFKSPPARICHHNWDITFYPCPHCGTGEVYGDK